MSGSYPSPPGVVLVNPATGEPYVASGGGGGGGSNTTEATQLLVLAELQALDDKTPAPVSGRVPVATAARDATTREFNQAGARLAVGAASARVALPALAADREVELIASTRCFYRFGDNTVAAALDGNSRPLPADLPYCTRVPAGATHVAVIRDTADGFLSVHAVA